jgi:hypothetical protein
MVFTYLTVDRTDEIGYRDDTVDLSPILRDVYETMTTHISLFEGVNTQRVHSV